MKEAITKKCDCAHEFQDKTYGKNIRLWNPQQMKPKGVITGYRCTVCSKSSKT